MATDTDSVGGATSMEMAKEKYEFFWKSKSIFSQWYKVPFTVEGIDFNCAEQYMMYKKADLFSDTEAADRVLQTKDPGKQKSIGRKVQNFTEEEWLKNRERIVEEASAAKFSQNKSLKEKLFATHPKTLVEASPVDTIWGIGYVADHVNAWDEKAWRGLNLLGYALTKTRDKLMKEEGLT